MSALHISPLMKFLTASALFLACSLPSLAHSSTAAYTPEYYDYYKLLEEHRNWAGLSTKTAHIGDITWTYSEGGSKNKPTLLLIHGLDSTRDAWIEVAHNLTQHYHVIVPDLPGSGSSKVPLDFDYSLPNMSEQLRVFAETLRIQNQLHIAGHSLGATIAMFYASHYNHDTRSLFVMGASGIFQNNRTNYSQNPVYLKQLIVTQPGDLNYVRQKTMVRVPFVPYIRRKSEEQLLMAQSVPTEKMIEHVYRLTKQYSVRAFKNLMGGIHAPTLIVWGKQDQIINVEVAHEIQTAIKGADTPVILNNVGHMPLLEAPQRVSQSYLDFLNKVQYQAKVTAKY